MAETKHRALSASTDRDGWVYTLCRGDACIGVYRTWKSACRAEEDWASILSLHCEGRWQVPTLKQRRSDYEDPMTGDMLRITITHVELKD